MRDLTTRTRIGNSVDINLLEKLKELSHATRIPMSRLLDEAIEDLIKKHQSVTSSVS
jgi:post-segregation antitoxin (ccd killing protein)